MDLRMLNVSNAPFVDEIYQQWLADPLSVDPQWQQYFQIIQSQLSKRIGEPASNGTGSNGSARHAANGSNGVGANYEDRDHDGFDDYGNDDTFGNSVRDPSSLLLEQEAESQALRSSVNYKQGRVTSMIWAYRDVGYLYADLNPLKGYQTKEMYYRFFSVEGDYDTLSLAEYGLTEKDLDAEFYAGKYVQPSIQPLRTIIDRLRQTYCSTLGIEVMHLQNRVMRRWLFERLEGDKVLPPWSQEQKIIFQKDLVKSEEFEHFIHSNFVGQKRFSLEGGEVLIPALRYLFSQSARAGVTEIVLGMAHRGRLNVFVNALGKEAVEIFAKFEDSYKPHDFGGNGDVKYHLGFSKVYHDEQTGKDINLSLVANPSHLEAVNPVVEGKARALQRRRGDLNRKKVLPILIHGDAAFAGQGVVPETLNLSQLKGYRTGGTVHIITNNQIGFTTASRDSRSTFFATDIAKSINIPIFHVNGDDPEAVARAMHLALAFRQKFGMDVIVDIICYRRLGHNETDEPSFTHPKMYAQIKDHPTTPTVYGRKLDKEGTWSQAEQDKFLEAYKKSLDADLKRAKSGYVPTFNDAYQEGEWKQFRREYSFDPVKTGVPMNNLDRIARTLVTVPTGFTMHPKLQKIVADREKSYFTDKKIDWGMAEALAFGTLLVEGHAVRLSGEDCQRGTFSHRHAVWWDVSTPEPTDYAPLKNLSDNQAVFAVYDSPLSEFSVLGFEYGYSLSMPNYLIMWEAQFGDFANGAQVIIDQFIAAGETKWFRSSGLVMLLPHGYEGQGPEHSSAHLDRFLARCGEDNMQVVNITTPAQFFHLLRKQMKQNFRKPLIVMSPKSLLRHKAAVSDINLFASDHFHYVLDDPAASGKEEVVLLCTGKVYYDLVAEREKRGRKDVAIIRMEQLYPFPARELREVFSRYNHARRIRWVQEENKNHGAWSFIFQHAPEIIGALWPSMEPGVGEVPGKDGKAVKAVKSKEEAQSSAPSVPCPWGWLDYAGRAESASPATGSHKQHTEELAQLMDQAFGD